MVIFSLKTLQKPTTTHVTNPEEETTHRSSINTRKYNIFHIYFRPFVSDRASRNIVLRESVQVASSLKRTAKKTHTHKQKWSFLRLPELLFALWRRFHLFIFAILHSGRFSSTHSLSICWYAPPMVEKPPLFRRTCFEYCSDIFFYQKGFRQDEAHVIFAAVSICNIKSTLMSCALIILFSDTVGGFRIRKMCEDFDIEWLRVWKNNKKPEK